MRLIDAHHHLWQPEALPYGWLRQRGQPKPFGDPTPIQRDYLWEHFRQDVGAAAVELIGSVHVQADGALPDPVAETKWLHTPDDTLPSAVVGFVDLSSDQAEATILRHKQFSRFRGVRQIIAQLESRPDLSFAPQPFLRNATWRAQLALLHEHHLSFDLQLYPEQMPAAAELLSQLPEIPVVLDHAGSPYDQTEAGLQTWATGIALLAQLPNVHVKLSGFGMFDRAWDAARAKPLFETLYTHFSPARMLWGSNFPVDRLMRSYAFCVAQLQQWLSELPATEQQQITCGTAQRVYRL
jgi:predicted TIM-barrel fold metal-dependent hydrolase